VPDIVAPFIATDAAADPVAILVRLVLAVVLGCVVAGIHAFTAGRDKAAPSFLVTLVLLSVLIAMVTQVIGNNVARAFGLVGALSIVRFRTVVRDTRDTAFVIFAVVVGMATGAANLWLAGLGVAVVGIAALLVSWQLGLAEDSGTYTLRIRLALGRDFESNLAPVLDPACASRRMLSVATNRQGAALEYVVEARLRPGSSAEALVKAVNLVEGIQDVRLERDGLEA
jgi:hypothetical protein